jgi:putative phage-type endonuclease
MVMGTITKEFAPKLIDIKNMTHEQWLGERRKGIGGSDIGAIMGVNPYKSALEVWYDKVKGKKEEEKENIPAELGLYLEDYLSGKFIKWFAKNHNGAIIKPERMSYMLQHPDYPFIRVNLDFMFDDPSILGTAAIECKTTNEFSRSQWDEEDLPDSYYLQAQQQLAVTGWQKVYMPCLIGNRKIVVKEIPRNEEIIEKIIITATNFWNDFVLKEIPPAPDGSVSAGKILDELYNKEEEGKVTEFPPFGDEVELLDKYNELNISKKETEKEMEVIKQKIKAEMGDAEIAIAGRHKITWKEQVRPAHMVKESRFRMFKIYSKKEEVKNNG